MDSLIAMDRQDEAMVLYETTTELLYKELGLTPSDQMKERFRQLEVYQHDKADHVNEIQEGLNQEKKTMELFSAVIFLLWKDTGMCRE